MLQMGPSDLVMLMLLELAIAIALARASRVRALGMVLLGLLLGTVGTDVQTGAARLTMGVEELADGIGSFHRGARTCRRRRWHAVFSLTEAVCRKLCAPGGRVDRSVSYHNRRRVPAHFGCGRNRCR